MHHAFSHFPSSPMHTFLSQPLVHTSPHITAQIFILPFPSFSSTPHCADFLISQLPLLLLWIFPLFPLSSLYWNFNSSFFPFFFFFESRVISKLIIGANKAIILLSRLILATGLSLLFYQDGKVVSTKSVWKVSRATFDEWREIRLERETKEKYSKQCVHEKKQMEAVEKVPTLCPIDTFILEPIREILLFPF